MRGRNSRSLPPETCAAIAEQYAMDVKVEAIAAMFRVSRTAVQEAVRRLKMDRRPPHRRKGRYVRGILK